ncbi:G-alpha-domain-containing protein [Amylostereum chailletii]|nr:G-alpha-domain-containing protein [Amylostereum chailletii]
MARGQSFDADDPLAAAIAPPKDETPEQREAREKEEAEAKRISDEIDEQLKAERAALKKKKPPVKVLLLGQSESGKSTTLKNFQMKYAADAWQEERLSWRAVIQLNLIRSITLIVDLLNDAIATSTPSGSGPSSPISSPRIVPVDLPARGPAHGLEFTEHHRILRLRLTPLKNVQKDLERRLGSASEEVTSNTSEAFTEALPIVPQEFYVRSRDGWRSALERFKPRHSIEVEDNRAAEARSRKDAEVSEVIAGCAEDMQTLWDDPLVKELLKRKKLRMEEAPGFFLNDIKRVAARDYEPSDADVVRARLRTLGVQEYSFNVEESGHEWKIYDVGGTRSSRTAWFPYFDDMNAIIFLAPISAFDERLREDRRVNRLEDSFVLWQSLCSLKLLARTQIVLFLNKCDLLEEKLKAGAKVKDWVPSFRDRSNDLDTVKQYFQAHFKEIARQHSPEPRRIYVHLTSVTDTKATGVTLRAVEEGILRDSLQRADLL